MFNKKPLIDLIQNYIYNVYVIGGDYTLKKKLITVTILLVILATSLVFLNALKFSKDTPLSFSQTIVRDENKISIPEGAEYKDIVYKKVGNEELHLDLYTPTKIKYTHSPTIMYIHGGSWAFGDKTLDDNIITAINKIRDEGFSIISIDYRLTSENVKFPLPVEDCKDAVRWFYKNAKEYNLDVDNLGLWGVSAGAHLSLMTAYTGDNEFIGDIELSKYPSKVKYVVDYFGPTTFFSSNEDSTQSRNLNKDIMKIITNFIGNDNIKNKDFLKSASPISYISKTSPATLIVHGEKDSLVPISQSYDLYKKGENLGVPMKFIKIPSADHDLLNIGYMDILKVAKSTLDFIKQNTNSN